MKSKKDKLAEAHTAYQAAKTGTRPKRGAKDGSIPTHPVVPVPDLPEAEVLKQCLAWLRSWRVFCDRHDCGSGPGHARYGIKGAGDIIGILPDGRHFEIECKRGRGGRLKKGQQERMAAVQATGAIYFVVHGIPELEYYMEELI
ncbi:MAG: hypothetical protein GY938_30675 [Ketobacter sp.]|nr:hypothetical protein [Ketobacter sp.]